MEYLALDLSTTCTGWAVFDKEFNLKKFGKIQPPKSTAKNPLTTEDRIYYIYKKVYAIVKHFRPKTVLWEDQFSGKNGRVGLILSQLRGALLPVFMYEGIKTTTEGLVNNTIKKRVTGSGKATKEQMADSVREIYKNNKEVQSIGEVIEKTNAKNFHLKNDDIYDAIAIGIAYKKLIEERALNE